MSKFCNSCGAQLEDDAVFCTNCGATQQNVGQPNPGNQYQQQGNQAGFTQAAGNAAQSVAGAVKQTFDGVTVDSVIGAMNPNEIKNVGKTKNNNTIIRLCAIAAVIIIVVIILCIIFGGKSYEKPIDNLCKAIEKTDGSAMADALPDYINDSVEDYMDSEYDSVEEYYEEMLYDILDEYEDEYGKNIKIKYDVIKKKEIKESDLEDKEDEISEYYDEDVKVSKGYELKVEMTIKGKDDDDTDTSWISVYKIDGKWVLEGMSALY